MTTLAATAGCGSLAQNGALLEAEQAYYHGDYERALLQLAAAERYNRVTTDDRSYVSFMRARALEGLGRTDEATGVYEYIVTTYPDTEYGYRARARLTTMERGGRQPLAPLRTVEPMAPPRTTVPPPDEVIGQRPGDRVRDFILPETLPADPEPEPAPPPVRPAPEPLSPYLPPPPPRTAPDMPPDLDEELEDLDAALELK